MDKHELNVKLDQMWKQTDQGDYETAMKIADKIDWRKITNVGLLTQVSDIYERNGEYREAKEILLLAFEHAPQGKGLLMQLTKLAILEGSMTEAERFYDEFKALAPEDSRQYLLRYLIMKGKHAPSVQQLAPLERYVAAELDEQRMYELAELYHEVGRHEECVALCDRIMILFATGSWVEKAIVLKTEKEGVALTEYQQALRDRGAYREEPLPEKEGEEESISPEAKHEFEVAEDAGRSGIAAAEDLGRSGIAPSEDAGRSGIAAEDGGEPVDSGSERGPELQDEIDAEIAAHIRRLEEEPGETFGTVSIEEEAPGEEMDAWEEAEAAEAKTDTDDRESDEVAQAKRFGTEEAKPGEEVTQSEPGEAVDDITRVLPPLKRTEAAGTFEDTEASPQLGKEEPAGHIAELPKRSRSEKEPGNQAERKEEGEPKEAISCDWLSDSADPKSPGAYSSMVEGKTAAEGLSAAIERIKQIHAQTGIHNPAAKVKADKLNLRGVSNSAEKIAGKDLIIEEAGDLSEQSVLELLGLMKTDAGARTILLVDNPLQLKRLSQTYPELARAFGALIPKKNEESKKSEPILHEEPSPMEAEGTKKAEEGKPASLRSADAERSYADAEHAYAEEELDLDAFAHYASDYAKKIDCVITGKSMLALYERIEIMQEDGVSLTRKNAEALIEEVADRAEKPGLMRRLCSVFSKKYDSDGMLILKEDDFIF